MAHNRSELVGVEGEIEVAQNEGFVVFLLLGDHDVALLGLPETAPISPSNSLASPTLQQKLPLEMEIPFFLRFLFVGLSISSANRNRSMRLKETEHSEMLLMV